MRKIKYNVIISLSFIFMLLLTINSYSVPAPPYPLTYQQEDGTKFKVRLFGDERYIRIETIDGYTIIEEGKNWYYAKRGADGDLVSTGVLVGKQDPKSLGLEKHILPTEEVLEKIKASRLQYSLKPIKRRPNPNLPNAEKYSKDPELEPSISGTGKMLVILADFPPGPQAQHHFTTEDFTALFDFTVTTEVIPKPKPKKEIGENGTLNAYFKENSYGQFDVGGQIVDWVLLSKTYDTYCAGAWGTGTYPNNSQGLCEDLIKAVDTDVDFTLFDTDGDSVVDAVTIVFEGFATGRPDLFWPHAWGLGTKPEYGMDHNVYADGMRIERYNIVNEQQWNDLTYTVEICQIGTFCHEYTHVLGAPDLYDYNPPFDESDPVSTWCLMAIGCYGISNDYIRNATPTHMTGFIKSVYMGWLIPTEITHNGEYQIFNLETLDPDIPSLYKVGITGKDKEYFLIENRNRYSTGIFDKNDFYGKPDTGLTKDLNSGLIITHIDENMPDGDGRFNDGPTDNSNYGVFVNDLGEPDDLTEYPWQYKFNANFSKTDDRVKFTPNTYPYQSNAYDETWSGIGIVEISEPGEIMTFVKEYVYPPLLYISYFDPGNHLASSISNPYLNEDGTVCFVAVGSTKTNYPGTLYSFNTLKSNTQDPEGPLPITDVVKALDTGAYPVTIDAGYNDSRLAVMCANDNIISVYNVDMSTGVLSLRSIFKPYGSVFNKYTGLVLHPTLPIGYAASQDDTIGMPGAIYVFSLDQTGYFWEPIQKILVGNNPQSVYLIPYLNRLALVNAEGNVQIFNVNTSTGLLTERGKFIPPDVDGNGQLTTFNGNNVILSPGGSKGYIAGKDEGVIFVFDATLPGNYSSIIQTIPTSQTPLYIAMNPNATMLSVINAGDAYIYYYKWDPLLEKFTKVGDVKQKGQAFTDVPITSNIIMMSNGLVGFAPCRPTGRIVAFDTRKKNSQPESLQFVTGGKLPTNGAISQDETVYALSTEGEKITRIYRVLFTVDSTDWELFE